MSTKRESFTNRIGFVLAAAGSAIGLGNLWRFPFLVAQKGGGIFILAYVIFAFTFGLSLLITEITIGRKTRQSSVGAYKAVHPKFGFLGVLTALVPIIILPYYGVIGGWVTKYGFDYLIGRGGEIAANSQAHFNSFISMQESGLLNNVEFFFFLYLAATACIVLLGVQKGIEKASKILLPVLIVLTIGIILYTFTIPGVTQGLKYYFLPDFSFIKSFKDLADLMLSALGQLFYSLSLSMAIMITFGSYMKEEDDIHAASLQIVILDSIVAIFAGLMIVPPVVAFHGGDPSLVNAGPGLMFVTLPQVFANMPGGNFVGAAFFVLVFFAALTSSISLMEAVASIFMDLFKMQRKNATIAIFVLSLALGTLSCLGYGPLSFIQFAGMAFLDFFDFLTNSIMMPIIAICTCLLIGHVVTPKYVKNEVKLSGDLKAEGIYNAMLRWISIPILSAILLSNVIS